MKLYKVLMYGSRHWQDMIPIGAELNRLVGTHGRGKLVIIEGGAPGADALSRELAEALSVHVCEVKALWDTRGRGAGPQRNKIMAGLEPDEAICFHGDIQNSLGSKSMMKILDEELDLATTLITD